MSLRTPQQERARAYVMIVVMHYLIFVLVFVVSCASCPPAPTCPVVPPCANAAVSQSPVPTSSPAPFLISPTPEPSPTATPREESVEESKRLTEKDIPLPPPITYYVTTPLNVRSGPSTAFPVVRQLAKGAQVTVVGQEGIWSRLNDSEYISIHFLRQAPIKP